MTANRLPTGGLYAITIDEQDEGKLLQAAEVCLAGGVSVFQYRDKLRPSNEQLRIAKRLRHLCDRYRIPLFINDDLSLALACKADGIHLGSDELDSLPIAKGAHHKILVGVSCYDSLQRARDALAGGADYVAFGSVFGSSTKPSARRCSLDLLRSARNELTAPIVAIGGLTPENGRDVIEAGADFLAVISGIFGQADVMSAVSRYVRLFS